MSNWFIFYHINRQGKLKIKKKDKIPYALLSLLIIFAGIWLIHALLTSNLRSDLTSYQDSLPPANFSPSVGYWGEEIQTWAENWDISPLLVATVMQIESCGDPQAISPAGAQGLFQVMPYHFEPGEDMLDPQTNARRGLAYLHASLQKANFDLQLALAGYNGGHGQIGRDPTHWPQETQRYAHWGYSIYEDAVLSSGEARALNAWLNAGGWLLCQQAELNLGLR
jgi:hypothetical protein